MSNIRNFAIIAHIDHGKSTLADRFLELTGMVQPGKHEEQLLDRNPISRERGITIKLAPVTMKCSSVNNRQIFSQDQLASAKGGPVVSRSSSESEGSHRNSFAQTTDFQKNSPLINEQNEEYILNLIDTPGHVDFSYEVDRTLACVEGVILLVDATQGIQAQTIANAYKAIEKNLVIIPAVNKIDLPNADIAGTKKQLVEFLGISEKEIFEISAKTGQGAEKLLQAVIEKIPTPCVGTYCNTPLQNIQALIFDSYYDQHRGVIAFVRVFTGQIEAKTNVALSATKTPFEIQEVGVFSPDLVPKDNLRAGEIGYVVTNLKDIHKVQVGDTIVDIEKKSTALAGYKRIKPMVYASIFPTDPNEYVNFKKALEKLYLTDSALEYAPIYSKALGAGFRVGFLGLLHADVVRERLEREYNQNLIITPPKVDYQEKDGHFYEPIVKITIITPQKYVGVVMRLCEEHRAKFITMDNKSQIYLQYAIPMTEMVSDFFDLLKSVTSGYASFEWEFLRFDKADADKLVLLLNLDEVEEFSEIVVRERANDKARDLTQRIKEIIPRQQYEVRIQAKYKGKIIASERITAFRKDVTKKLYGGDRTRKDKLLEKQKEGKKKMKMIGKVEIPKEAFLKLFKRS